MQGGNATYFGATVPFDLGTLAAIEFALMAGAESFRGAAEVEKRVYPGGAFDPVGLVRTALRLAPGTPRCHGRLLQAARRGLQPVAASSEPIAAAAAAEPPSCSADARRRCRACPRSRPPRSPRATWTS